MPWFWKAAMAAVGLVVSVQVISSLRPRRAREVVRKVTVSRGDLRVTTSATGEVKPQNRVEVKPPIAGRVEAVLVREGEEVAKGTVLAWMSSTERAALLDAARSQGEEAVARWEQVYKPAPLVAPLEGTVIVRAVEPGQTVTTADPVVVLADRLIVEALVDETDLALIAVGQEAEIRLDAYRHEVIQATVDHLAYESRLINNVNVYAVDVLPSQVPATFRSGMTASITFLVAIRTGALLVPSEAITEWPGERPRPDGTSVAVYQRRFGGTLEPVAVRIGQSDGRMTEIVDGVKEGQEVLVVRRREQVSGSNPFSAFGGRRRPQRSQ